MESARAAAARQAESTSSDIGFQLILLGDQTPAGQIDAMRHAVYETPRVVHGDNAFYTLHTGMNWVETVRFSDVELSDQQ